MIALIVLFAILVVASVYDVLYQKIPNWLTYSGILLGLVANLTWYFVEPNGFFAQEKVSESLSTDKATQLCFQYYQLGLVGITESIKGFLFCALIMVFCFVFFSASGGIGGGDVKLISMFGTFMGIQGIEALLWTVVLGALAATLSIIWKFGLFQFVKTVVKSALSMIVYRKKLKYNEHEEKMMTARFYMAPGALVAGLIVGIEQLNIYSNYCN